MRKFLTVLIVILVLLVSIFLQINLLNVIPLFGVISNLGIVLIVGFGLMNGKIIGGLTGAFYGLLIDIIFSKAIGINLALYTLTGLISGNLSSKFSKDNRTALVMMVMIITGAFELLNYFLVRMIYGGQIAFLNAVIVIIIEAAYNLFLTVILYKFIVELGDIINKAKNSYYLL